MDQKVTVTDVDMPFHSMIVFMIKWILATASAFVAVSIALYAVSSILLKLRWW